MSDAEPSRGEDSVPTGGSAAAKPHSRGDHTGAAAADSAALDVAPIAGVEGVVVLPGSKSISNRTLLLAALADGETRPARALCSAA